MGTQFYTAQEEFLRSIDPILLIEQIRKFRMLDFKDLSKGEISNAIYEALSWNGKIIYLEILEHIQPTLPFSGLENFPAR